MNDDELKSLLQQARTPQPPAEFWDLFPRRIAAQLKRPRPLRTEASRPRFAWALAAAACVAMALAAIGYRHWQRETNPYENMLQNAKVIQETLSLFPNQVRAIIQDEHGLQLVLSDKPDVPNSTPLWIKVCEGKKCRAMVTFSGQEFQIAKETVEVLMDAQGQVMVVGDRLFWSSADPNHASDRLRIQARPLTTAYAL